jgi:hypothetical protein
VRKASGPSKAEAQWPKLQLSSFSSSFHATKDLLATNQCQQSAQHHALIYSKKKSHGYEIVRHNAPILLIAPYNGFGGKETWSNWGRTNGLKMLLA